MLVFRQLQILSLSRPAAPLFLAFFSAKTKLSDAGQQALWAHRIIKLIKDPAVPTELSHPSILEQIEAMDVPESCEFDFKRQDNKYANKTEVMKMMTEGITLNTNVFKQQNLQRAKQTIKQLQQKTRWFDRRPNGPIIFHPSYIVTSYIFNILDNPDLKPFILTGKAGIGKTIAIIFYIHLNNFITKYVVQCSKDPQLQKQLELLQKENLLNRTFLKYWYWSVQYDHGRSQYPLQIEKLILEQIVELDQKEKDILHLCKDFSDFRHQLAKLYPNSIQRRVIVDQSNKITSKMRNWNTYDKNKAEGVGRWKIVSRQKNEQLFQLLYCPAFNLCQILKKFITLGTTFGLNSSQPIEGDIIKNEQATENGQDARNKPTKLALNLDQSLEHFRIPYETIAIQPQGRVDFWNIGWFEIWRRLKTVNVDPKIVEEIKKIYLQTIKNNKVFSYFIFERLRYYIHCLYLQATNAQYFIPVLKRFFDNFPQHCLYQEDNNLKVTGQLSLLYILQDLLFSKISNESQRNKLTTFDLSLFEGFKFQNSSSISQIIEQLYGDRTLEIIPFQNLNENNLSFYWSYQELYQVITHFLFPNVDFQFFANYSPLLSFHVEQSGGARGAALEKTIKENLTSNTFKCIHYPVAVQNASEVRQEKIKMDGILIYTPKNLQIFQQKFESLLQSLDIMKDQNIIARLKSQKSGENYNVPSIGIDFIIAKYEQDKQRHLVRTYKITALGDCSETVKRFKESGFPQLTKMAQARGYQPKDIKFEHIVLSLRKTIDFEVYKEPTLPHQVTIFYSDLTKLNFSGSSDEKEKYNLRNFQRYCQVVQQFRNHTASPKTN